MEVASDGLLRRDGVVKWRTVTAVITGVSNIWLIEVCVGYWRTRRGRKAIQMSGEKKKMKENEA